MKIAQYTPDEARALENYYIGMAELLGMQPQERKAWNYRRSNSVARRDKAALQLIRQEGPLTRRDVAERLRLTKGTADNTVKRLETDGKIEFAGRKCVSAGNLKCAQTGRRYSGKVHVFLYRAVDA